MSSVRGLFAGASALFALVFWPVALVLLVLFGRATPPDCADTSAATSGSPSSIVGDSITFGARALFEHRFAGVPVTAVGGMAWGWGRDKVQASSGDVVPYLLGTNGGVKPADVESLLRAHPGVRFVLMTVSVPQPYEASTNAAVKAAASKHPQQVFVADWHAKVGSQPDLLGLDRIHPGSLAGSQAFVDLVAATVGRAGPAPAPATHLVAAGTPRGGSYPPQRPGQHHYTQAQMQAAVAKYDPRQAVALGAIAMAETSGWNWPTTNPTGEYHGPWAFQAAWAGKQYDLNRLDADLDYAAQAAAKLAADGITHQKWETWPDMAARFMPGGSAAGQGGAVAQSLQPAQLVDCVSTSAAVSFSGTNVKGPGGGYTGTWDPSVMPLVRMLHDRFHVAVSTYPGHDPSEGLAVDLAVGQFGDDWNDGSPGHPGKGPQWQIAQWVAANLVDKGLAKYVVHHASIHNRERDQPGVWRAIASQASSSDPTYTHMDHVHVSFR